MIHNPFTKSIRNKILEYVLVNYDGLLEDNPPYLCGLVQACNPELSVLERLFGGHFTAVTSIQLDMAEMLSNISYNPASIKSMIKVELRRGNILSIIHRDIIIQLLDGKSPRSIAESMMSDYKHVFREDYNLVAKNTDLTNGIRDE